MDKLYLPPLCFGSWWLSPCCWDSENTVFPKFHNSHFSGWCSRLSGSGFVENERWQSCWSRRRKQIGKGNQSREVSVDNSNTHRANSLLLFVFVLHWWYFVRWRETFMEPEGFQYSHYGELFHVSLTHSNTFESWTCQLNWNVPGFFFFFKFSEKGNTNTSI